MTDIKISRFDVAEYLTDETLVNAYLNEISIDDTELHDLLGKVYHKMATESKPLDADMAKILSDNILDLF